MEFPVCQFVIVIMRNICLVVFGKHKGDCVIDSVGGGKRVFFRKNQTAKKWDSRGRFSILALFASDGKPPLRVFFTPRINNAVPLKRNRELSGCIKLYQVYYIVFLKCESCIASFVCDNLVISNVALELMLFLFISGKHCF